jgi:uncharacterized protein (DUF1684 family)
MNLFPAKIFLLLALLFGFSAAANAQTFYGTTSCPIPLKENFLQIEINAGEKNY